jgi:hypothetical protein
MNAFKAFVETIVYQPNPNQNLDRTLPANFGNGNPAAGRNTYLNEPYVTGLTCNTCHTLPNGSNSFIAPGALLQEPQSFKVPQLRNAYQKRGFVRSATAVSLSGFGFTHDGADPDLFTFLSRPVFGTFAGDTLRKRNLEAFVNCLDTGVAPTCGYARTVEAATAAAATADWTLLEAQANAGNADLTLAGSVNGARHSWLYRPGTNDYLADNASASAVTRATLQGYINSGGTITLMGVPPGSGSRMSLDRDGNGIRDADETLPNPVLSRNGNLSLRWPASDWGLIAERSQDLANWRALTDRRTTEEGKINLPVDGTTSHGFFRLRRP